MDDQRPCAGMAQQRDDLGVRGARVHRYAHQARGHRSVVSFDVFPDIR